MALKENYVDDILNTSKNTKRKYNMITNADGTVSFEDVTEYSQNGDNFGASDINITNKTVNELIAMGLNVRCNSEGYLEVKLNDVWELTEIKTVTPKTYLYKEGVFNTNIVSGWSTNDYQNILSTQNYGHPLAPTLTLNSNTFTLYAYGTDPNSGSTGMYATNDKIDLSNYSSINIDIPTLSRGNTYNGVIFKVMNRLQQDFESAWELARIDIVNAGSYSLDISAVNEDCYICIALVTAGAPLTMIVSNIWLE